MLIKLAAYSDIPEGGSVFVQGPAGLEIALFRVQGEIFALNNACPHQGGPLAEGQLHDFCVTCPWHAWDFDVRTGECVTYPGENAIKIPIIVQEGDIYLKYEPV